MNLIDIFFHVHIFLSMNIYLFIYPCVCVLLEVAKNIIQEFDLKTMKQQKCTKKNES